MLLLTDPVDSASEYSLISWFMEQFYGDGDARSAAQRVLSELLVFYLLIIIGFGALWITWRSNFRIRAAREQVKRVLREQQARPFDAAESNMYGMY